MQDKPRILLKISGGQLKKTKDNFIFNQELLDDLINQIVTLSQTYTIGIVVGGGNIWRGRGNNLQSLSVVQSDYIGMLSTILNGIVLRDLLEKKQMIVTIFSAIECPQVASSVNIFEVEELFKKNGIAIFCGGTGSAFVTTDTAAAIRALQIKSPLILMGKENIKGIYDKDPNIHDDAKFYDKLTYSKIIADKLNVMDQTALTLTQNSNITWLVFNQSLKNSFVDAINKKIELTTITK